MEQFNLDFKCTKFVKAIVEAETEEIARQTIEVELKKQFAFVEYIDLTEAEFHDIIIPEITQEDESCLSDTLDAQNVKQIGEEETIPEVS